MVSKYEIRQNILTILIEVSVFVIVPAIVIGIFAPAIYAQAYTFVVGVLVLGPIVGIDFGREWALLELVFVVCFLFLLLPLL